MSVEQLVVPESKEMLKKQINKQNPHHTDENISKKKKKRERISYQIVASTGKS